MHHLEGVSLSEIRQAWQQLRQAPCPETLSLEGAKFALSSLVGVPVIAATVNRNRGLALLDLERRSGVAVDARVAYAPRFLLAVDRPDLADLRGDVIGLELAAGAIWADVLWDEVDEPTKVNANDLVADRSMANAAE